MYSFIHSTAGGPAILHKFTCDIIAFYATAEPLLILRFIRLDLSFISWPQMSVEFFFF